MKKTARIFVAILSLIVCLPCESAPSPTPSPSPEPKKKSLIQRIFKRAESPTPQPAESATPAKRKRRGTRAAASPAESPEEEATPSPTPRSRRSRRAKPLPTTPENAEPSPAPTPSPEVKNAAPDEKQPAALGENVPFVPDAGATQEKEASKPDESSPEQDAKEKARFREVKATALEDKKIQSLKEQLDNSENAKDERRASKEYYKSLYLKMRKIDPSLKDRIDRMEAATMKQIGSDKSE